MTFYQARERLGVMLMTASSEADKEALRVARGKLLEAMNEPVIPRIYQNDGVECTVCPRCTARLEGIESYCWDCGVELDWDGQ